MAVAAAKGALRPAVQRRELDRTAAEIA